MSRSPSYENYINNVTNKSAGITAILEFKLNTLFVTTIISNGRKYKDVDAKKIFYVTKLPSNMCLLCTASIK